MDAPFKLHWYSNDETRPPYGETSLISPDPRLITPIGFPPPWEKRPWIYGVMVVSANGVTAWDRKSKTDDPVWFILGQNPLRPERLEDKLRVLYLYTFGDASVGAQTVRDQEEVVLDIQEPGKEEPAFSGIYHKLYDLRLSRGLPRHSRNIVYTPSGRDLDFSHPIFNTRGIQTIIVTTQAGKDKLLAAGAGTKGIEFIVAGKTEMTPGNLIAAHEKLFSDYGTRYLDCMGGETMLNLLHQAGILDEVFVTITDVVVRPEEHTGVKYIVDFKAAGARLIAEGGVPGSSWKVQRWRFNER
ncbi:MAG: hypothetical protein HYT40_03345 [Candidatus Sungbacteria bacterium]|uniref:Bacterial bifunctional deaminase-reductase C-terminal domain-containing protein n=1 Tax=Candidatus Sungiibacteriota bacterium TaxID=2750080 RepID=A0A931SC14_9BACT|nr:hypothetical protein [Candidatus Sungbacteria bacterium]